LPRCRENPEELALSLGVTEITQATGGLAAELSRCVAVEIERLSPPSRRKPDLVTVQTASKTGLVSKGRGHGDQIIVALSAGGATRPRPEQVDAGAIAFLHQAGKAAQQRVV